jgi:hypothetical protein
MPNASYYDGFNRNKHLNNNNSNNNNNNKIKAEDNSYNDFNNNDRSFSNRTPLIEHYQNYSIPR